MSGIVVFLQALLRPVRRGGPDQTVLEDGTTDPLAYEWLRLGSRAALEGNREDARYYFVQAVRTDLNFARGWLYLGGVASDPALTLSCLRKVLQLDHSNVHAHAGILWAREKLGLIQPVPIPQGFAGEDEQPAEVLWSVPEPVPFVSPAVVASRVTTLLAPPETAPPALLVARNGHAEPFTTAPDVAIVLDEAPTPPEEPERSGSERLLRRGVRAAVAGNRPRARYYFLKSIASDSSNTRAWLYFGGVAADPSTTFACMERVLQTELHSTDALAGLRWAQEKLGISGELTMRWWRPQ